MNYFFSNLKRYGYFIFYSAKADLRSEVANSYLNWIWWVLEPFLNMCVFTFVYGTIFGIAEPYFPVFIYSGLIIWNFFSKSITSSVKLIRANKSIISKLYVPKFVLLLEKMLVNAYKMLFSAIILVIMIFIFRVPITSKVVYIIPIMIETGVYTFAISLLLMHFGVFIDDLAYAMNILIRLWMYLSGIMYHIDKRLDAHLGNLLKTFNPMALFVNSTHNVLLYDTGLEIKPFIVWLVLSCLLSAIGLMIIKRYENSYVKVI